MPSVRDLKGRTVVEEAAPVTRPGGAPVAPEPPAILPDAALQAKRRLEARSQAERPHPLIVDDLHDRGPRAPPDVPLPADLEAAILAIEQTIHSVQVQWDGTGAALDDLRTAVQGMRERAEADHALRVQLDGVKAMLAKVLG